MVRPNKNGRSQATKSSVSVASVSPITFRLPEYCPNLPMREIRRVFFAGLMAVGQVACMGGHGPSPDQVRDSMADYRARNEAAYKPLHTYEPLPEQRESWQEGSGTVEISLSMPDSLGADPHPLVLYLPGLGEEVDAGGQWREAWVRAGYAVISLQAPHHSGALRQLSGGEDQDPRWVGHRHFSESSMERRQATVQAVLDGLNKRRRIPGSVYAKIDLGRVVIAGYDFGAQTAAALAGEKLKTPLPALKGISISAVLLFSPHVDLAAGNLAGRFKSIGWPFLAVTSTEDSDPFGMSSPSLRREIWKQSAAPDQYLLVMEGGSHSLLSGNSLEVILRESDTDRPERGHGLFGLGAPKQWSGDFGRSMSLSQGVGAKAPTHESVARQLIAIQEITTAFLDEQLYRSETARSWLKQSASGYLGSLGSLKRR